MTTLELSLLVAYLPIGFMDLICFQIGVDRLGSSIPEWSYLPFGGFALYIKSKKKL